MSIPENPAGGPPPISPINPVPPPPNPPPMSPPQPPRKSRATWVVAGIGCLSVVIIVCVVAAIIFSKARGVIDQGNSLANQIRASRNKLVGSWKKGEGDPTVQTFKSDGTIAVQIFGKNLGKPVELLLTGTYRLEGDTLYETYKDVRLVTKIDNGDLLESMMKSQMAKQMKFGEEQSGKINWSDANTFSITEGKQPPQVWKRQ
jgi:hypothetical protein